MPLYRMFALFLFLAVAVAQPQGVWTTDLSLRVQAVGGVTPSPNGALVVYTQTQHVIEQERSEQRTQIFLAKADGSERRQLTFGEKSATAPSFSPDGRFVYFRSARTGHSDIWRIPIDGGEAQPVTNWKGEIGEYAVSPDNRWLAFAGWQEPPDEEMKKKQKRDFWVVDENPKNHTLWLVPTTSQPPNFATPKRISDSRRRHKVLEVPKA